MDNRYPDDRRDEETSSSRDDRSSRSNEEPRIFTRSASDRASDLSREGDEETADSDRGQTDIVPPVMPAGAAINATGSSTGTAGGMNASPNALGAIPAIIADEVAFSQDDIKTGWPVIAADDVQIGKLTEVGPERLLVERSDIVGKIYIPYVGVRSIDDNEVHLGVTSSEIDMQDWQQILPGGPKSGSTGKGASGSDSSASSTGTESGIMRSTSSTTPVPDSTTVSPRPSETDSTARPAINVDPAATSAPPVTSGRGVEEGPTSHTVRTDEPDNTTTRPAAYTPYTAEPGQVGGTSAETYSPSQPTAPKEPTPPKEMGAMRNARNAMDSMKDTLQRATHGQVAPEEPKEAFADMFSFLENIPNSFYYLGTVASVLASLVLFLSGKRWESIFVGLWAPTILSASMFYKLLRPSHETRRM